MHFFIDTGPGTPPALRRELERLSAARVLPIRVRPPLPLWALLLRTLLPGLHSALSPAPLRTILPGHQREQALREYAMAHPEWNTEHSAADNAAWAAAVSMVDNPPRPMRHTETEVL